MVALAVCLYIVCSDGPCAAFQCTWVLLSCLDAVYVRHNHRDRADQIFATGATEWMSVWPTILALSMLEHQFSFACWLSCFAELTELWQTKTNHEQDTPVSPDCAAPVAAAIITGIMVAHSDQQEPRTDDAESSPTLSALRPLWKARSEIEPSVITSS